MVRYPLSGKRELRSRILICSTIVPLFRYLGYLIALLDPTRLADLKKYWGSGIVEPLSMPSAAKELQLGIESRLPQHPGRGAATVAALPHENTELPLLRSPIDYNC